MTPTRLVDDVIQLGDIVGIGLIATGFGRTSVTMRAEVRNLLTGDRMITVDRIVGVDEQGRPLPHGHRVMTRSRERLTGVSA